MLRHVLGMAVPPLIALPFLVTWYVLAVVPTVLHKEDSLVARVVLTAMFGPVFRVTWGHMHVDRWAVNRDPSDYNRLPVDNHWLWIAADVEATIEPGLTDG
jgi:hypothetical protein